MTILTIIGTITALTYYLSVTQYGTKTGFLMLFGVYFSMVVFIYGYFIGFIIGVANSTETIRGIASETDNICGTSVRAATN